MPFITKWRLDTADRVGMVHDVVREISRAGADIRNMEVLPRRIFVTLSVAGASDVVALSRRLAQLPDIEDVQPIAATPQEEREAQLSALLASVSEGIIAADRQGRITMLNPRAEAILHISADEAVGKPIAEALGRPDMPMIRALETGEGYDHEEMEWVGPQGRLHYITTGRVIRGASGEVTGVVATIKDMVEVRELVHSLTRLPRIGFEQIVFESQAMRQTVEMARAVAQSDATVLITGESGTGKEVFARAIHDASPREARPFVPVNCAAIPETLLESELFGYEEGAFTGARRGGKQGLFEFAHGGTIFLDEIGEMPTHLQAKLLRVIESGKLRRVGGRQEIAVDVRVIAATNRDLTAMVAARAFREDLYYRLNVIPLHIPPLRERPQDIGVLARHFLARLNAKTRKRVRRLSRDAEEALMAYGWPGNVRELENAIERAVHLTDGDEIRAGHLLLELPGAKAAGGSEADGAVPLAASGTLKSHVSGVERDVLAAVLGRERSVRAAARVLGISHTALLNKIKRYGLERPAKPS